MLGQEVVCTAQKILNCRDAQDFKRKPCPTDRYIEGKEGSSERHKEAKAIQ